MPRLTLHSLLLLLLLVPGRAQAAATKPRPSHGPASRPAVHLVVGRLLGLPSIAVTAPGTYLAQYLAAVAPVTDQKKVNLAVVMVRAARPSSVLGPRVLGGTFMYVGSRPALWRRATALRALPRVSFAVGLAGGALALSWSY